MVNLKIPYLKSSSDQFLFRKKISLSRKSKRKLLTESFFMLLFSIIISYLNFLIPNKNLIFTSFSKNIYKLFSILNEFLSPLSQLLSALFISITMFIALLLFVGAIFRIFKVMRRKSRIVSFNKSVR